ncbi:MAG TPA: glycosyltransferase family 87 protein [Devosia sp.]|nr:glycosyltransferase family 87 protein [Devosia sp.]
MYSALVLLIAGSVACLAATLLGGVRHDYIYYLEQWRLVLAGLDPWSTNNAYGPLHNAFALLLPLDPLAPKIATALSLLIANALLVLALERTRPRPEWQQIYLLAFALNVLPLVSVFWFGNNDGFVAALVIGAVLARLRGRVVLAGLLLGLATLDKYYPLLLVPFFALDARRFEARLVIAALLTTGAGMLAGALLWGRDFIEAVAFGISRDATILSIIRPISLIGRKLGVSEYTDLLVRFNSPIVLAVWIGALALAWRRRDNWLVGACWGLFAVLLAYKVGHQQFMVSWLALVACLPLLRRDDADRLARLSLPFACFLSVFQAGFVLLQPEYYRGPWVFVPSYVGLLSFALGLLLLLSFLRPASRPAPSPSAAPHAESARYSRTADPRP